MKNTILLLILIFFTGFGPLFAQQKLTLDLNGARKYALEHNKMLLNSDYAVDKAQQALREAIANGLPQFNATLDYSNALGAVISIRFIENMPPSEIPIKPQSNFNFNVGQLIFSGNYIVGVQTAKLARDLRQIGREKSELDVLTQATDGYYLVLVSKQLLEILRQNVANLQSLYNKTVVLERVGIIEKTNLDQLSVQVNALKNAVNASERQLELATNMLRLQLGVSAETEIELTEKLDDMLAAANYETSLVKSFSVQQNIDLRLLSQQEFIGAKMVDMRRASALPTLSAYYRHTYKLLKPDFDMSPANVVGLQMSIPLFSSGVRMAQVKQAAIDLKTIQNNKELLSDQLKIQEKQLRFNYNNAQESFINQKNNIEVSRRVYESLKFKYEQGLISGLDLIAADNNYLRAETDYISAIMQLLSSNLQLNKLYGNLQ
ncbi:MAG: TolC family protein [Bacteroidales bacterium]|nr:TolC family protein [Bacteroidales bacterium]